MRQLLFILAIAVFTLPGYSHDDANIRFLAPDSKKLYVDFLRIDSVVIETIEPGALMLGGFSVSRKHFSEVFEFLKEQGIHDVYKFKISDRKERMYFCEILNHLPPYKKSEIEVYPDEVADNPNLDWLHTFNQGEHLSNDPLELRTRIRIYFRDGEMVTGYASSTSLDILNYRYVASCLTSLIQDYVWFYPEEMLP